MEITLMQGIALAAVAFMIGLDIWLEALFIFRPIIVSTLTGMILGDVPLGLLCGGITELAFAGLTTAGGSQPPNPVMAGVMSVVIAHVTGQSAEASMALALPFAFLMQYIVLLCYNAFTFFMKDADRAAKEADVNAIYRINIVCTLIVCAVYSIMVFLCAYAAQDAMAQLIQILPEWLTHGFKVVGGLLPAVGFAMLMRVMLKGEFVPYLLIGFVISCFLDFSNLLPVAIIGASLALIAYNTECKISGKTVAVEQTDNRTGRIVEKKDITRLGLASMFLQASFNYERMQAGGFLCAQLPLLKKIYKDDKEGLSAAMQDNLEFITTHPNMAGFLMGLLISMEEAKADRSTIKGMKLALFAPLAGVGDAIFWFTLLPIVGGIAASMAMDGSIAGPVIFFLTYLAVFIFRIVLTHLGYNLGTKAIGFITEGAEKIGRAATILGCTVIGALIASYVKLSVNLEIPVNEVKTVHIQTDFFDKIFPNILSIGYVFLMYYLLKKKKFKPITLIIGTFLLAIVCSFFGIL